MTEVPSNEPHQQDHILRSAKPTSCPNKAQAKQIALTPTNHPSPGGFLLPCRNSTNALSGWHCRVADQEVQEVRRIFALPKTVFGFPQKIFSKNLVHFQVLYLLYLLYRPKRDRGDRGDSLTFEQKSCVRFFL